MQVRIFKGKLSQRSDDDVQGDGGRGRWVEAVPAHTLHRDCCLGPRPRWAAAATTWGPTEGPARYQALRARAHSMLVKGCSWAGIASACGLSSLSSLRVVASRASWDTTAAAALQAVSAALPSWAGATLPGTAARP